MKKVICSTILVAFLYNAYGQIAYYGSIKIRKDLIQATDTSFSFIGDSVSTLTAVLKAYLPEKFKNDTAFTESQVLTQFKDNPFF